MRCDAMTTVLECSDLYALDYYYISLFNLACYEMLEIRYGE